MARPRRIPTDEASEIERLRAALKPFADYGRKLRITNRSSGARMVIYDAGRIILTLGDFDRAAELVEAGNGDA